MSTYTFSINNTLTVLFISSVPKVHIIYTPSSIQYVHVLEISAKRNSVRISRQQLTFLTNNRFAAVMIGPTLEEKCPILGELLIQAIRKHTTLAMSERQTGILGHLRSNFVRTQDVCHFQAHGKRNKSSFSILYKAQYSLVAVYMKEGRARRKSQRLLH